MKDRCKCGEKSYSRFTNREFKIIIQYHSAKNIENLYDFDYSLFNQVIAIRKSRIANCNSLKKSVSAS
jgi:hypothetical protein